MQKTFALRKFQRDDLQKVIGINHLCLPENYSDFFFIELHRRFPESFIVAAENGEIVGYIMCRIEAGLTTIGLGGLTKKGHIVSVAVMPDYRRKSIGEALVNKAMEAMKLYHSKQCYLEVRVTNDSAIKLYKKLGFDITRTINGYYADGEDAYVMAKKL